MNNFTVSGPTGSYCYFAPLHTNSATTAYSNNLNPILDSGASSLFVTDHKFLVNERKNKTQITTANGTKSFTSSSGKYKLYNGDQTIYLPAFFAPSFTQKIISIGQLSMKHDVAFTKNKCYLQSLSAITTNTNIIGSQGSDNLYMLSSPVKNEK